MIQDLRQCTLFANMQEPQIQRVLRHAVTRQLKVGETLFEQGDHANRFYLLSSGQIKLFRLSPAGNEKVVDIITPGSTFAEALMFLERPHYPVGAQALQPSTVISIDSVDFADMLRNSVETCFLLMGDMSQRLRGLLHEIDELSLYSATCRVAAYLATNKPADSDSLKLPVAKQVLASRLSTKPETFSRIFKDLSKRGLIEVEGNQVRILDLDALKDAADSCSVYCNE